MGTTERSEEDPKILGGCANVVSTTASALALRGPSQGGEAKPPHGVPAEPHPLRGRGGYLAKSHAERYVNLAKYFYT